MARSLRSLYGKKCLPWAIRHKANEVSELYAVNKRKLKLNVSPMRHMNKSVYMVNLGCPKNLVDGEVMLGLLCQEGYRLTLDPEQAAVLMVNTCSFINEAKEESIDTILEFARYKDNTPAKQLIVTGCLAQRYGRDLREALPEVDVFVGTGEFVRVTEILRQKRSLLDGPVTYIGASHVLPDHTAPRITTTPFYTAYLKVAEGC